MPDNKLLKTINIRESLLEEFDEEIFNALVEKNSHTNAFCFWVEEQDEGRRNRGVE
ncbi:hypothetical protein Desaci_1405 [Desulfosporosinus acidiphilus SJ4]|uniref:Uncharacterized protein n=1 Tax=Desulfosporosinus acidiphilus (strain DSM 22704 / JCM 16185 / SJ4) TaxID=646529 RepID=I4D3Q4_DESAJ|nr:hypothetical protein [Desulfosporosinus acidiphilus]AFM40428.1 hypothetical protein Desaci_1405 [Desulfosporosinus acidiphilus SJ4]